MSRDDFENTPLPKICQIVNELATKIKEGAKLLVLGDPLILPYVHGYLEPLMKYRTWIVVRTTNASNDTACLPNNHEDILVYSNENGRMNHSVMRVQYEYCKSCNKTVKDYGGKKHLYHEYGTALSDVWKDFSMIGNEEFPAEIIGRVRDLFSIPPNKQMVVVSLWNYEKMPTTKPAIPDTLFPKVARTDRVIRKPARPDCLINGDCIEELRKIRSGTIDMIFVDPPYNPAKKHSGTKDKMVMDEYYKWCDVWLNELSRVLKRGGSMFVLNVPKSAARHFLLLRQKLHFQNWIAWDALSTPLGTIMPAHYTVLYFTKGPHPSRLNVDNHEDSSNHGMTVPPDYGFCSRPSCVRLRRQEGILDRRPLTDLWTDVHRVKHNSLREDHPTLLPQKLLQRLILMASDCGDLVLDCFNGVGTTTLVSAQLGRKYIGIEKSSTYATTSKKRHEDLRRGADPFAKRKTIPSVKNSTLKRVPNTGYKVPKRTLQIEVREISKKLGRLPNRDDLIKHSAYPIEYFDTYFRSWSEVTEAARTTGMSEIRSVD